MIYKQLKKMVDAGKSVREMVKITDKSRGTIQYWLFKYSLKSKAKRGRKRKRFIIKYERNNCNNTKL